MSFDVEEDKGWKHCGSLIPETEAKVVDPESGKELDTGEKGELLLRGPGIMKGYYEKEKETAEAIDEDGWLHTGRKTSEGMRKKSFQEILSTSMKTRNFMLLVVRRN